MAEEKKEKKRKKKKKGKFLKKLILFLQLIILFIAVVGTVIAVLLFMNVITIEDLYPYMLRVPYVGEKYIVPFIYPLKNPKITVFDRIEKEALIVSKEEKLKEIEKQLDTEKKVFAEKKRELDEKIQETEKLNKQLSAKLLKKKTTWDKNIDALVNLYSSMTPDAAAQILEKVDKDIVVEIMRRMTPRKASLIMEKFSPDFAAEISKELGLKTD